MRRHEDQVSRSLNELSALVFNLIKSPSTPISFSHDRQVVPPPPVSSSRWSSAHPPITPTGFAFLLLGVSMALMLCGSVTFFIGFLMMPWVLGLVMVLYVAGFVSTISVLGCSILCYATATSPPNIIPAWKLL